MKYQYYASFAAGFQYIVKDILEKQIQDIKINQLFDGAVVFETEKSYDKLNMYCLNNIFYVIAAAKNKKNNLERFIDFVTSSDEIRFDLISNNTKKFKTFRVIVSLENTLTSINNKIKLKLEKFISLRSKLKINRSNSDAEFWILYRTEGYFYFLKRLSRHTAYEKILNKGELHPEIAYLMNWFSQPDKNDIFLDPFCGNGAIPIKRALHFPVKQIYAFDADLSIIKIIKNKIAAKKSLAAMQNLKIKQIKIENIENELQNESVDKIVTDPPWGLYETAITNIEEFYFCSLLKMEKILKTGGIIVMLIGRHIDIAKIIKNIPSLQIEHNYEVLVSGKKSNIVKIRKSV